PYAEGFDSPQAYGRVIEVLLEKSDLRAAMALVMHWVGQADEVSLDEGRRSFYALAVRWMQLVLAKASQATDAEEDHSLILKFFDYLEANADDSWEVPDWQPGEFAAVENSSRSHPNGGDEESLDEAEALLDDDDLAELFDEAG